MNCRISLWRSECGKWRIDLFGVWRRRVSLGKCVNVSTSVRRGGARWNRSKIGLWNEPNHLWDETDYTRKKKQQHKAPEKCQARLAGTKAKKQKQHKTNTLFFLLDIFQTADDKTTLNKLEESKSNRQVCLTVSWIRVEAEAPHHIKPCKFSWKPLLSLQQPALRLLCAAKR